MLREIVENKLNLKDERSVEAYIEKVIDQNYSEDELSVDNAWKVYDAVNKEIKSGDIRDESGLLDSIFNNAKRFG